MNNFVQRGDTITVLAPYDVTSGGGVKVGGKFGIAAYTAVSGAQLDINVTGVYDLAKDTSTFTDGDSVYWDDSGKKATSTSSSNTLIGSACLTTPSGTAALGGVSGDATVRVRLNAMAVGSISSANIDASIAQTGTTNLSAANIIAMGAAPISVIAAPGAGKAVIVEGVLFEITTTSTQFTGGAAVHFYYHGGTTDAVTSSIPAATVTAVAGTSNTLLGPAVATNGTVVPANTGVDITTVGSAAFAAGTGTAKVFVKYRVITL